MLAAASIAVIHNIPICHLHGGESTEGVIDDSIRHAITKLSSLHFVAHKKYRDRVIQMGENPKNVHCVGALGLGSIINKNFSNKLQIENLLNIKMRDKNFIVTYHPVTLTKNSIKDITELFSALNFFKEICFIITSPNMDTEHNKIITKIKNFVKKNDNVYFFKSLGKETYFDLLNSFDGVLGNSSSGIIEVPSFKKATINIGERQKGRIQSKSVINCKPLKKNIIVSIKKIFSHKFKKKLKQNKNLYYLQGTENKIFNIIKKTNLKDLKRKCFFDNV
jgi:GDP/UDP-N,N'-diacetylbacillosamine 2-epimerase (hydrolysing)